MTKNWLTQRAEERTVPALICADQVWTFPQLEVASAKVAQNLINLGVIPKSYVAVLTDTCADLVILIHALTRLNCVFIPLHTRLSVTELQWQVRDSGAEFLVFSVTKLDTVNQLQIKNLCLLNLEALGFVAAQNLAENLKLNLEPDRELPENKIDFVSVQAVIYTSGTTGLPKGVQLTYKNHYASAIASAQHLGINPKSDRWLNCLPLYHIGGLSIIWRSVIWGIPMVLLPRFDIAEVCEAIANQAITFISLVPTMLVRILYSPEFQANLLAWQKLQGILLGGAAASPDLLDKCLKYQLPIMPTYGLTEASSQVTTLLTKDILLKNGSSGKALGCNQVRIVCLDDPTGDQTEMGIGAIGQIMVRGENVMKGYLHHPDLGINWLNTGDVGYLDADGFLYVLNRRSDLIISGGENIYPTEIEAILAKHPQIQTACVVGIADKEWGEIVVAVLQLIKSETNLEINLGEVRKFCEDAGLARYKLPQKLYIVNAMTTTANGKVSRKLVREAIAIQIS
ncbi:O-succinylbenzoate-CoA ligase [Synechococcus sp. PCC 7502]|uniref:o-succinylbenzoate--CoA ligase n=1 Tax=Synechococcus sp. PCC 7502 TaxID=1173263 RepID=UPI00029FEA8D|nr:o-succinylbenzoate--CoA ligase [Synechococcus sp. PCC 7502]AFY75108.1 O-succinylbenzoate-CoA ligase [Synechococcus sp. PCC 7502]